MDTGLPQIRLDEDELRGAAGFARAREILGFLCTLSLPDGDAASFTAAGRVWMFGDLIVEAYRWTTRLRLERLPAHVQGTSFDQFVVLHMPGGARIETEAGVEELGPRHCAVVDRARPITAEYPAGQVIMVTVPRAILSPLLPRAAALHGLAIRAASGELLRDYLCSLERQLGVMTQAEAPFLQRGTCELIASCIAPSPEGIDRATEQLRHSLLAEARRVVDAHIADEDFGPDQVAETLAVSRAKLYRLFEPEGGVAAFIQRRRLRAAHRMLVGAGPPRRVSEIAFACGFKSEAHFSRAYRTAYGAPPSEARRAPIAGAPVAEDEDANVAQVFRRWMLAQD